MQLEDPGKLDGRKPEDGGTESELEDNVFFNEDLLCDLHGQSHVCTGGHCQAVYFN